jgi:hypothetical protein
MCEVLLVVSYAWTSARGTNQNPTASLCKGVTLLGIQRSQICHKWMCLKPWSPVDTKAGDPIWTGKQTEQMLFLFSNMFFGSWTIFLSTSGNSGEVSHSSLNLWKMPQLPAITNTQRSLLSAAPSTLAILWCPVSCVPSNLLEMSHYSNGSSETASVSNASCLH